MHTTLAISKRSAARFRYFGMASLAAAVVFAINLPLSAHAQDPDPSSFAGSLSSHPPSQKVELGGAMALTGPAQRDNPNAWRTISDIGAVGTATSITPNVVANQNVVFEVQTRFTDDTPAPTNGDVYTQVLWEVVETTASVMPRSMSVFRRPPNL
jgi:hypothetical protein